MRARLRRGVVVCGQVVQDSFVEGGEHVELSRGKQVDEVPADVLHVPGRRLLDGGAASRQPMVLRASSGLGSRPISPSFCMRRTWWETRLFSQPSVLHNSWAGMRSPSWPESTARIS